MAHLEHTVLTEVGDTSVAYAEGGRPFVEEMKVELRVVDGPDRGTITLKPHYSDRIVTVQYRR